MLLAELVETSQQLAATPSRTAKTALVAGALRRAGVDEAELAATYLAGSLRQRRTGIGWRRVADLPPPAHNPSLTLGEADAAFEMAAGLAGPGSAGARSRLVAELFGRATAAEQRYLVGLLTGNIRQGALDGVLQAAIAKAAEVPEAAVRRAVMLAGTAGPVARTALAEGTAGLAAVGLRVGRPLRPMLAASAPDVAAAVTQVGGGGPVAVERKIDGIRLQIHKQGGDVSLYTRSLDDITDRLPEVVRSFAGAPARSLVVDAEAVVLRSDGSPAPFQETGARTATRRDSTEVSGDPAEAAAGPAETSIFAFDLLHLDGIDLLDEPAAARFDRLGALLPDLVVPRLVTADAAEAQAFFEQQVATGHEGVVVKNLDAPYAAGRRGAGWIKVKPRHTFDLVVLAVEWGSGRRRGKLSNIHLGARADDGSGFVMLGKTFKGMTDEMLAWQTARFQELETHRDDYTVYVRPEQVVEIAIDGLQRSTRYPGGVALRFARVLRYRTDKTAAEADTLATVRALAP